MQLASPITLTQLDALVGEYLASRSRGSCGAVVYGADCDCDIPEGKTLEDAIGNATLSVDRHGKKCPHQYRIAKGDLEELSKAVLCKADEIKQCRSFEALHDVIWDVAARIKGIGPLTTYDVSIRIGCFLKLKPKVVYLHAGTRAGARALGLDYRGATLTTDTLPKPLCRLSAALIEDFLCIYKDKLGPLAAE